MTLVVVAVLVAQVLATWWPWAWATVWPPPACMQSGPSGPLSSSLLGTGYSVTRHSDPGTRLMGSACMLFAPPTLGMCPCRTAGSPPQRWGGIGLLRKACTPQTLSSPRQRSGQLGSGGMLWR